MALSDGLVSFDEMFDEADANTHDKYGRHTRKLFKVADWNSDGKLDEAGAHVRSQPITTDNPGLLLALTL